MAKTKYYQSSSWKALRQQALKRDRFVCQNCGVKCYGRNAPRPYVDHIIPRPHVDGPTHEDHISNLATLCGPCHTRKTFYEDLNARPEINADGYPSGPWSV